MKLAAVVPFHKYTPFGGKFYEPLFNYFMKNYNEFWKTEVDKLYILDSTWGINISELPPEIEVIKIDPNLRYFEAYEKIIPTIKEDVVVFLDDDMVIHREGIIEGAYDQIGEGYDVVSIYDTIGPLTGMVNAKWPFMKGKTKFCPYFFMARTKLLQSIPNLRLGPVHYGSREFIPELNYFTVDGDWGETLGEATIKLLAAGAKAYEMEEDKDSIYFDGVKDGDGKKLGYYHIRAGSTPAYLLATKAEGDPKTYDDYLKNQPKREYLRQVAWYLQMCRTNEERTDALSLVADAGIPALEFMDYLQKFSDFHGL